MADTRCDRKNTVKSPGCVVFRTQRAGFASRGSGRREAVTRVALMNHSPLNRLRATRSIQSCTRAALCAARQIPARRAAGTRATPTFAPDPDPGLVPGGRSRPVCQTDSERELRGNSERLGGFCDRFPDQAGVVRRDSRGGGRGKSEHQPAGFSVTTNAACSFVPRIFSTVSDGPIDRFRSSSWQLWKPIHTCTPRVPTSPARPRKSG